MRTLLVMMVFVIGCRGASSRDDAAGQVAQADSTEVAPHDTATAEPDRPPEPPLGRPGRLVLTAPSDSLLTGSWPAGAGRCAASGRVRILIDDEMFGVAMLLAVPDSAPLERRYPVLPAASTSPQSPSARIGIHRFKERLVSAWQAVGGELALTALDRTISGSFQVRLEELVSRQQMFVAGTFRDLRLAPLPAAECRAIGEEPDSTAAPDTTGVTLSGHGAD